MEPAGTRQADIPGGLEEALGPFQEALCRLLGEELLVALWADSHHAREKALEMELAQGSAARDLGQVRLPLDVLLDILEGPLDPPIIAGPLVDCCAHA